MTQRERFLAILVGGMLAAVVVWWGFGKYRTALRLRNNEIQTLRETQERLVEQRLQGEYANRQMGEYMSRSLPGNPEKAQSEYQDWLLGMALDNKLTKASVDPTSSRPIGGLYQKIDFRVQGNTNVPNFIKLLHAFYAKDYLHRIRDLSLTPTRDGDFRVEMSIDAIALLTAPDDLPEREEPAWRVDADVADYEEPILNRNFFEPPNGAPRYNGRSTLEAFVGRDSPAPLTFRDPEGHNIRYEFVEEPPEFVRLDPRSGTLRVRTDEKQEFEVLVRAIDDGYPRRSTEQKLTVRVVDAPKEAPPAVKRAFDDSTQTVLTGLVHGRDQWTAWMHVRTQDRTLRLKVNDTFEIGSLKGKVVEVTPRFVILEIDGRKITLKQGGNLGDAANSDGED